MLSLVRTVVEDRLGRGFSYESVIKRTTTIRLGGVVSLDRSMVDATGIGA